MKTKILGISNKVLKSLLRVPKYFFRPKVIIVTFFVLWVLFVANTSKASAQTYEFWNLETGQRSDNFAFDLNEWVVASSTLFGAGDSLVAPQTNQSKRVVFELEEEVPQTFYIRYVYQYSGNYPSFAQQHGAGFRTNATYDWVNFSYPQNDFAICSVDLPCNKESVLGTHQPNTEYDITISFTLVSATESSAEYNYTVTVNGNVYENTSLVFWTFPGLPFGFWSRNNSGSNRHEVNYIEYGTTPPGESLQYNETQITSGTVSGTAATTTIEVEYNIDTTGYTINNRPDYILIMVRNEDLDVVSQTNNIILPLSDGENSIVRVINEDLEDGVYYGDVVFWNIQNNSPAGYQGTSFSFTIQSGSVLSYLFESSELPTNESPIDLTPQPCGITSISGCIINAMTYLFIPSQERMESFSGLWERLGTVIPFGYVFQIFEIRGNMQLDGDTTVLPNLSFADDIFQPIRNGLVAILWVSFAFYLYNRFKIMEV